MRVKKLVSALSALAITVTAMAGLAVNAGAADTSKQPVLSADYTVAGATSEGFEITGTNPYSNVTEGEGLAFYSSVSTNASNLRTQRTTAKRMFNTAYSGDVTVKVTFEYKDDVAQNGTVDRLAGIRFLDENGNSIIKLAEEGQYGYVVVDDVQVTDMKDSGSSHWRNTVWTVQADINFTQGTFKYTITTNKNGSYSGTKSITATGLGGIQLETNNNRSVRAAQVVDDGTYRYHANSPLILKNLQVYRDEIVEKYYSYAVQYVNEQSGVVKTGGGNDVEGATIPYSNERFTSDVDNKLYIVDGIDEDSDTTVKADGTAVLKVNCHEAATYEFNVVSSVDSAVLDIVSMREGDGSASYAYPKYLTDSNNVVTHTCDVSEYYKIISEEEAQNENDITINYTAYAGNKAYFYDYNGSDAVYYPENVSCGDLTGANENPSIVVAEDGVYTVEVKGFSTAGNGRTLTVVKGEYIDTNTNVVINSTELASVGTELKAENVELKAGDVITVHGSASTACLDYILLTKTDDITPPELEDTLAIEVPVEGAEGVKAFMVKEFALDNAAPTWTITATPTEGEAKTNTVQANIPNVQGENVNLGLIVDNVPDGYTVSATLGY